MYKTNKYQWFHYITNIIFIIITNIIIIIIISKWIFHTSCKRWSLQKTKWMIQSLVSHFF